MNVRVSSPSLIKCNILQGQSLLITACDNCTLTLLDGVDDLKSLLYVNDLYFIENGVPAPWVELDKYENDLGMLEQRFRDFNHTKHFLERSFDDSILEKVRSLNNFFSNVMLIFPLLPIQAAIESEQYQ